MSVRDYMEWNRHEMLDYGRSRGCRNPTRRSLLVEDPSRPVVRMAGRGLPAALLDAGERRRLLANRQPGQAITAADESRLMRTTPPATRHRHH